MKLKDPRLAGGVVIIAVILGFLFWKFAPLILNNNQEPGPIALTYWGFEDERVIKPLLQKYETLHPNIKIKYVPQNTLNYRTRLQTQLRAGSGPDLFWLHHSWIAMFAPDIQPAPTSMFSLADYQRAFFPIAKETLTSGDQVLAVPNELDGLVMYYNEDILRAANVGIPALWADFVNIATTVTVRNQLGQIQTAGAALGTTTNIDYWSDLLGLLFLQQPQADLTQPASAEGVEVLKFYTSFVQDPKLKTWDVTLSSSTQMFAEGKLAFYFAPASQAVVLKNANASLNFKTAPIPQLPGKTVTWGSFSVTSVSNRSAHQKETWEFLKYLSSAEGEQQIVDGQTQFGPYVKPFARVELAKTLVNDPIFGSFVKQGPYYKGWYLNFNTQDAGINDEMIEAYSRAVNGVLSGQNPQTALNSASGTIQTTIDKYTKPASP